MIIRKLGFFSVSTYSIAFCLLSTILLCLQYTGQQSTVGMCVTLGRGDLSKCHWFIHHCIQLSQIICYLKWSFYHLPGYWFFSYRYDTFVECSFPPSFVIWRIFIISSVGPIDSLLCGICFAKFDFPFTTFKIQYAKLWILYVCYVLSHCNNHGLAFLHCQFLVLVFSVLLQTEVFL